MGLVLIGLGEQPNTREWEELRFFKKSNQTFIQWDQANRWTISYCGLMTTINLRSTHVALWLLVVESDWFSPRHWLTSCLLLSWRLSRPTPSLFLNVFLRLPPSLESEPVLVQAGWVRVWTSPCPWVHSCSRVCPGYCPCLCVHFCSLLCAGHWVWVSISVSEPGYVSLPEHVPVSESVHAQPVCPANGTFSGAALPACSASELSAQGLRLRSSGLWFLLCSWSMCFQHNKQTGEKCNPLMLLPSLCNPRLIHIGPLFKMAQRSIDTTTTCPFSSSRTFASDMRRFSHQGCGIHILSPEI